MIDLFNSLVESQKLPIFSVSGEPYNELLARIALQVEVDCLSLGHGSQDDDYLFFKESLKRWSHVQAIFSCIPLQISGGMPDGADIALAVAEGFATAISGWFADGYDQLCRCFERNCHAELVP